MRLADLAALSARLATTSKRTLKIALIAELLGAAAPDERGLTALYLSGAVRQTKLGLGYAQLAALRELAAADSPSVELRALDAALERIAEVRGAGAVARRTERIRELLARCTAEEQAFVVRLILGELRQGALESLVLEAVAKATGTEPALVRRAQMLSGDLAQVTALAFVGGASALGAIDLVLFRPVQPMLAEPAESVEDALGQLGRAAFELKLDGARVQVHLEQGRVRVFTRALNDVTDAVPELVELVAALPARTLVLDGEVIALRPDGSPQPFQETMRRFGRKLDVARMRTELPLSPFFFDCLYCDGESLLNAGTEQRLRTLERVIPGEARVPRIVTAERAEAEAFLEAALLRGHEGVMAKALDAPYSAGSRGASWLKLKHVHTLDLVVLAAEWGSGRRTGSLSNLHLGARDDERGGFVMLGKTFKGLTDELLRFQTEALLARETHREAHVVFVRPELVVEIAFNDVQTSSQYPGGFALRFARVKRYRPDKPAELADTVAQVRAIHARSQAKE